MNEVPHNYPPQQQQQQQQQQHIGQQQQQQQVGNNSQNVQVLQSSPWTSNDVRRYCTSCLKSFDNFFNRRHHCRLCGDIFCHLCSEQKALIPPSFIVLQPKGGKKVKSTERRGRYNQRVSDGGGGGSASGGAYSNVNDVSFERDDDPDRTVTFAKAVVDRRKTENRSDNPQSPPQSPLHSNAASDAAAVAVAVGDSSSPSSSGGRFDPSNSSRSVISSIDGLSYSIARTGDNGKEDAEDDDFTFTTIQQDEDNIAQLMAGLEPPTAVDPNYEVGERKIFDDDADDGDLSVSVASSTGLSYVSSVNPSDRQNVHQQTEPMQDILERQESQDSQEYYNLHSSVSSTTSTNTLMTSDAQPSSTVLYGKGLEERMKLAREPLRVCVACHGKLQSIQDELRTHNSNAMKYNSIDPTNIRRLLNSPVAFTLGHEVRKAAYTLNNLLPMPRRMGMFMDTGGGRGSEFGCDTKETCKGFMGNFGNIDGVRIPAKLLEQAKGVAVMTCIKTGMGVAGMEFGTGLVVSRLAGDNYWSPPCAIGTAGISWGALVGVQLSDHVFLLMTDKAVDMFVNNNDGSFQLGADIGVAAGPLGRSIEADIGASDGDLTPIYTYSLSKGFYAGISLDGKIIVTRHNVNEKFYGRKIDAKSLLSGAVPTPPAAQPLYDALKRCHVYASASSSRAASLTTRRQLANSYLATHQNNHQYSYGDGGLSSYESEEDYNMSSRHYAPY